MTLDDVDRSLSVEDLLIADAHGADRARGGDGRRTHRGVGVHHPHRDRGGVLRSGDRGTHVAAAQAAASEASKRFERHVDPGARAPAHRVAELLVSLAGGTLEAGETVVGAVPAMPVQTIDASLPERILGMPVPADQVVSILTASGVSVAREGDKLELTPPTWRADLVDPYDYVEEVGIKVGLGDLPSLVPTAPAGRGLTREQTLRRALGRALATAGFVEVLTFPWASSADADRLGLDADDRRRRCRSRWSTRWPTPRRCCARRSCRDSSGRSPGTPRVVSTTWRCSKSAGCSLSMGDDATPLPGVTRTSLGRRTGRHRGDPSRAAASPRRRRGGRLASGRLKFVLPSGQAGNRSSAWPTWWRPVLGVSLERRADRCALASGTLRGTGRRRRRGRSCRRVAPIGDQGVRAARALGRSRGRPRRADGARG